MQIEYQLLKTDNMGTFIHIDIANIVYFQITNQHPTGINEQYSKYLIVTILASNFKVQQH